MLKPCKCCGEENLLSVNWTESRRGVWYWVRCDSCGANTEEYEEESDAVDAWNDGEY